jgi:hypothetical protein
VSIQICPLAQSKDHSLNYPLADGFDLIPAVPNPQCLRFRNAVNTRYQAALMIKLSENEIVIRWSFTD